MSMIIIRFYKTFHIYEYICLLSKCCSYYMCCMACNYSLRNMKQTRIVNKRKYTKLGHKITIESFLKALVSNKNIHLQRMILQALCLYFNDCGFFQFRSCFRLTESYIAQCQYDRPTNSGTILKPAKANSFIILKM